MCCISETVLSEEESEADFIDTDKQVIPGKIININIMTWKKRWIIDYLNPLVIQVTKKSFHLSSPVMVVINII